MPAKIKVKIVAGRDFPIMDRASDLADPFVEVRCILIAKKDNIGMKVVAIHQ